MRMWKCENVGNMRMWKCDNEAPSSSSPQQKFCVECISRGVAIPEDKWQEIASAGEDVSIEFQYGALQ